jgi:hypothetical protein
MLCGLQEALSDLIFGRTRYAKYKFCRMQRWDELFQMPMPETGAEGV